MLQYIITALGGFFIGSSFSKNQGQYANGGVTKGGKVKKLYAVLRSPMGEIIADVVVEREDENEALKKFRDMGINSNGTIYFTNNAPHYYANGGEVGEVFKEGDIFQIDNTSKKIIITKIDSEYGGYKGQELTTWIHIMPLLSKNPFDLELYELPKFSRYVRDGVYVPVKYAEGGTGEIYKPED